MGSTDRSNLPTIEKYLQIAGRRVEIEDAGPDAPCALTRHLATAADWLHVVAIQRPQTRQLTLRGTEPHGSIQFVGDLERRMIEPLVLTLRALATGQVDLDTPATPVFLQDLRRHVRLQMVVSVACPYCPAATAVVLRLPCVSERVGVQVIRADVAGAPKVRAVPTLLDGDRVVSSGPMQEMNLVEALLESDFLIPDRTTDKDLGDPQ